MNILMLFPKFPEHTFWNFSKTTELFLGRRGLVPPLGLLTVASYLPPDIGVRLVDRNLYAESESDWEWADAVFLSLMATQQDDYRVCVEEARRCGKPIALGGPFTHARPDLAIADADLVCFGEAESIMEELTEDLRAGRRGKQYQGGNKTNMEAVLPPRFELLPDPNVYLHMAIQYSRGCPFRCEFCDIIEIYGRIPRTKTPQQILTELNALRRLGYQGLVDVVDDNFIGNRKKAKVMLRSLAGWNRENGCPYQFFTEASLNLADDDGLLEAMAQANFVRVFIGVETPDPKLLKAALKHQNIPGNPLDKIRKIREHGIDISAGFIIGFDNESRDVFETQRTFIEASGIADAMVNLLTAVPNTQLSRRLSKEGRLLKDLSLEGETTLEGLNFVPKGEMTKREYLKGYALLIKKLYAPQTYFDRVVRGLSVLRRRGRRGVSRRQAFVVLVGLFYRLGLRAEPIRPYFWRSFLRILRENPAALDSWAADSLFFHHLHRHAAFVESELSRYLSAPGANDVLDEVIPDSEKYQIGMLGVISTADKSAARENG